MIFYVYMEYRGQQEMELTHSRWIEDNTYIFSAIKNYLAQETFDMQAMRQRTDKERQVLTQEVLQKLPWLKRKIFKAIMEKYFTFSALREEARMCYLQGIWMIRTLIYEMTRRLISKNILRDSSEAAYLDFNDILEYTRGTTPPQKLFNAKKLNRRKQEHLNNLRVPPPPLTIIGTWSPAQGDQKEFQGQVLNGLGASSGCVSGQARLVLDLEEQIGEFRAGEILVTHFTNTAWTPLFNTAAAVVVDIGSLLSHASIVARELGIPAVVNTHIATQVIKTGDMLTVDGNNGKVYLNLEP